MYFGILSEIGSQPLAPQAETPHQIKTPVIQGIVLHSLSLYIWGGRQLLCGAVAAVRRSSFFVSPMGCKAPEPYAPYSLLSSPIPPFPGNSVPNSVPNGFVLNGIGDGSTEVCEVQALD